MGQVIALAVSHKQISADKIRQTRAILYGGMILDRPGWLKFST
jgi:hypothetical protein